MKIDKTKKEFRELTFRYGDANPEGGHMGSWMANFLEDAFGLEFKEEEPELPERLWRPGRHNILTPEGVTVSELQHQEGIDIVHLVADEAAARYNAVSALLRRLRDPDDMGTMDCSDLESQLETERERLQ